RPRPAGSARAGAGASGLTSRRSRRGVARGCAPLRRARRLRAALRPAGRDRGGAGADARARGTRDRAAPVRRGARRDALGEAGRRRHSRPAGPLRHRRAGRRARLRARRRRRGRVHARGAPGEREPSGPRRSARGGPPRAALRGGRRWEGRAARPGEERPRGPGARSRADSGGHQPLTSDRARPPFLPRGPLRAGGHRLLERSRARGCLLPGSGRVHAAPLGPGHRGPQALLRERARADRGLGRALRRRAAAVARGLHRPQRPLGARRRRLLLPPAHPPLSDQAHRGAHGPRPDARQRPRRALAGPQGAGADLVRVAILGAGGTIAPAIVRDLAESEEVTEMRLLDLDLRRAEAVAAEHGGGKAQAYRADATGGLADQLAGTDVLVNSAAYRVNLAAMGACLEARCHYMDLGGLYHVTAEQLELSDEFERAGLLALLGIGSAPGKTNLLAARAVRELPGSPSSISILAAGRDLDPPAGLSFPYAVR